MLNNLGLLHARLVEPDQAPAQRQRALKLYRGVGGLCGQAVTLGSLAYICH